MKQTQHHSISRRTTDLSVAMALMLFSADWVAQPVLAVPTEEAGPAEATSFKQVTSHLDAGGNFYLYLSTEQWLAGLSDKISGLRRLVQTMPNLGTAERIKANQVFDLLTSVVKNCGVEEVSGLGLSSIATEKGFYRNRMILHHYPGKNTGYLWSLFGKSPHPMSGLDLLPASTALASFCDFDLPLLWTVVQQETKRAGLDGASQFLQQLPGLVEMHTGLKLDQLLASLGNEYGIVLTLDLDKKIALPMPPNGLQIPEPGLMLAVKVNNDLVFDRVDELLKQQPNLNQQVTRVDKPGLKMRTMGVPLPLPLSLRPTLARSGDYLFLATADSLIEEVLAVKNGQKKGYKDADEFKRLSQGLPRQGNKFGLLDKRFTETIVSIEAEAMKSNGAMPPALMSWFHAMLAGSSSVAAFTVTGITGDGWLSIGNGTRDLRAAVVAPIAAVPGLLAAIAIPNFVRGRSTAQASVCLANLKQLDGAKEAWAFENKKKPGDAVAMTDLVPKFIPVELRCPAGGGPYILNAVGTDPTCPNYNPNNPELRGHKLGGP